MSGQKDDRIIGSLGIMRNIQPYTNKMYLVYPMKRILYQIVEFSCDSDQKLDLCIFYLVRKFANLIKWIIYVLRSRNAIGGELQDVNANSFNYTSV